MNKAGEFLDSKGIHIGYANGIKMVTITGFEEYSLLELMEQYAQQREREIAEWISDEWDYPIDDIFIDFNEWKSNHQTQQQ